MAISYQSDTRVFKLDAGDFSYAFRIDEAGYPVQLYAGPKLGDSDLTVLYRPRGRAFNPGQPERSEAYSRNSLPLEFSGGGMDDFRTPSALTRTAAGHNAVDARYVSHRIFAGKPALSGLPATTGSDDAVETLELTLRDAATGVDYQLLYSVFRDLPVLARSIRAVNGGAAAVTLEKLASLTWDRENATGMELTALPGAWARERAPERAALTHGTRVLGSRCGMSSHRMNPFFMLSEPGATEETGRVWGAMLVYSGGFAAEIELDQFDTARTVFGLDPDTFGWKLEPGQSFQTPEALLGFSNAGFGRLSRSFHTLLRRHLLRGFWRDRARPVPVNNWEATYFNFDTDKLLAIAADAAKLGVEMLVLDDGWFGHRDDDTSSLGDWVVRRDKFPEGLKPLADGVNALGLRFGLWFEPEMVSPDSDLYRAHPDWVLTIPGRTGSLGRHQRVLDFSRPEVVDAIFTAMSEILDSAHIEYIKWDANRNLTEIGSAAHPADRQGELAHRYVLGVYALCERLLERYPKLLIEGCSGGGGRFDAGMLHYAPQIWTSDDTDAMERLKIQYGTSFGYPCSAMGAHVSACPNHQTNRTTPFATRGLVAMAGTFGYELDLTALTAEEREIAKAQIAQYRRIQPLVADGDLYRLLSPFAGPVTAWMHVAGDRGEFVVTVIQERGEPNGPNRRLRLRGLDPAARYRDDDGREFGGDLLMYAGLPLPELFGDGVGLQYVFRKIS